MSEEENNRQTDADVFKLFTISTVAFIVIGCAIWFAG